jgi:hypothetical protein
VRFVEVHGGDWNVAQDHWEKIVKKVLQTDAVDPQQRAQKRLTKRFVRASSYLAVYRTMWIAALSASSDSSHAWALPQVLSRAIKMANQKALGVACEPRPLAQLPS